MCGRFYLIASAAEIKKKFNLDQGFELVPRYNIAPTQSSPIIVGAAKSRSLHMARWGLVPSWSRDLSLGARMINALAEEIDDKPVFRSAFHAQRCLVPRTAFTNGRREGPGNSPTK